MTDEKDLNETTTEEDIDRIGKHVPIYIVGLEKVLEHDPGKLALMPPIDLLKEIELAMLTILKYIGPKRKKFSAFKWGDMWRDIEVEFGRWAHIFNKNLRKQMTGTTERMGKEKDPEGKVMNLNLHNKFSWVNAYWWNRFHYLDKIMKSRTGLGGISTKKSIETGRETLHDLITGKADESQIHPNFKEVIRNLKMSTISKDVKKVLDRLGKDF